MGNNLCGDQQNSNREITIVKKDTKKHAVIETHINGTTDLHGDINTVEVKARGGHSKQDLKSELEENISSFGTFIDYLEYDSMLPHNVTQVQSSQPLNLEEEVWKYDLHKNLIQLRPVRFDNSDVYNGQWSKDRRPEGLGVHIQHTPRVVREGIFKSSEFIRGRIYYPDSNGSFYEGECQSNFPHGDGILYSVENPYNGQWADGKRSGSGAENHEDGVRIVGKYQDGKLTSGKIFWTDGSCYEGEITNRKLGPNGVFTTSKGNFYEGEWNENKMNGTGTFNWVGTNNLYQGGYVNGRKEGSGKYYFNFPTRFYEGKWLHDKPHGRGELHTEEKITVGLFRYGKLVQVFSEATLGGNDNGSSLNVNNEITLKKDEDINLVFLKEDVNTRFLSHLERSDEDVSPNSPSKKYKPVSQIHYQPEIETKMDYNQDLKNIREEEKKEDANTNVKSVEEEKKENNFQQNHHTQNEKVEEGHSAAVKLNADVNVLGVVNVESSNKAEAEL